MKLKRASRRGVRNPAAVAPLQTQAAVAPLQTQAAVAPALDQAPEEVVFAPQGLIIAFPDGNVVPTVEMRALILGECDVYFGDGPPVPLAPSAEVDFLSGGRVVLHGGWITFPSEGLIDAPNGCEITVPPGGGIEFAQ